MTFEGGGNNGIETQVHDKVRTSLEKIHNEFDDLYDAAKALTNEIADADSLSELNEFRDRLTELARKTRRLYHEHARASAYVQSKSHENTAKGELIAQNDEILNTIYAKIGRGFALISESEIVFSVGQP
jgi:hypothetical protein